MRRVFLVLVFFGCAPWLSAQSGPLDQAEILGRLAIGYPPSFVGYLVERRGTSFTPSPDFLERVSLAGGDGALIERLDSVSSSSSTSSGPREESPFDHLSECAKLVHMGATEAARLECRTAIGENPHSPWPLLISAKLIHMSFGPLLPTLSEGEKRKRASFDSLISQASAENATLGAVYFYAAACLVAPAASPQWLPSNALDVEQLQAGDPWGDEFNASPFDIGLVKSGAAANSGSNSQLAIHPEFFRRVQVEPELASNHIHLAEQWATAGDANQSQSELRTALRLEPDNSSIHIDLGTLLLSQQQNEVALAEFLEAVRIAPSGIRQHLALARAYERMGRLTDAIATLRTITAIHPANASASDMLVNLYLRENETPQAISELRRSLAADFADNSDEDEVVNLRLKDELRLTSLLVEQKRFAEAHQQYRYLIGIRPQDANLHNGLGNLFALEGKCDEAVEEYRQALRISSNSAEAYGNLSQCLINERNFEDAIAELKRGLDSVPDSGDLRNELARIYSTAEDPKFRDPKQALLLATEAVQISRGKRSDFLDTLAEAQLQNGLATDAVSTEALAVAADPENPILQKRLVYFRDALKRTAQ